MAVRRRNAHTRLAQSMPRRLTRSGELADISRCKPYTRSKNNSRELPYDNSYITYKAAVRADSCIWSCMHLDISTRASISLAMSVTLVSAVLVAVLSMLRCPLHPSHYVILIGFSCMGFFLSFYGILSMRPILTISWSIVFIFRVFPPSHSFHGPRRRLILHRIPPSSVPPRIVSFFRMISCDAWYLAFWS